MSPAPSPPDRSSLRNARPWQLAVGRCRRRLRPDWAAMVSLGVLSSVSVLAAITPFLPLQPPDQDRTELQYAEPQPLPFWLNNFAPRSPCDRAVSQTKPPAPQDRRPRTSATAPGRKRAEIDDAVQAPYRQAGLSRTGGRQSSPGRARASRLLATGRSMPSAAATCWAATCSAASSGGPEFRSSWASSPRSSRS